MQRQGLDLAAAYLQRGQTQIIPRSMARSHPALREKYTKVRGKGKDKVTLMVYMIGSDLETNSGMATSDLNEMVYGGTDNPKLNVIVETGGCREGGAIP